MLFDSHCHLTDEKFGDLEAVLQRAHGAGVTRLTTICSDLGDAENALRIARAHKGIWCSAGVHPHAAAQAAPDAIDRLHQLLREAEVVAVGETGLDYYYDNSPRDVQRSLLMRHFELAAQHQLPIIMHSRDAEQDTIAFVRDAGTVSGVLHCFAGSAALLDAGIEAGWMISFSGLVSFKNYEGADLVRAVPDGQLMVETDSPYLAPVPHRGKRNEPAFVREVAAAVARIRGVDEAHIAEVTTSNALRFYGLAAGAAELEVAA